MITIDLPFPPSVNAIWRKNARTVYRSKRYTAWLDEAGWEIARQRPRKIKGSYALTLLAKRPDNRRRDIDNIVKPVSDLLVQLGIVEDDCQAVSIRSEWTDDPAIAGCRVIIA